VARCISIILASFRAFSFLFILYMFFMFFTSLGFVKIVLEAKTERIDPRSAMRKSDVFLHLICRSI
jgi:hypothetical protein